ncbi:MAG: SMP-30/gluconolactonase/LRE family protein [Fimbriiglobus sp.]|jgi:gluconolactonase|nr:SMP-30/gluconolactonase/LRE family protein [Fimbriiglobus sp.]
MLTRTLTAALFAAALAPAADPASPFPADAKVEKLAGGFKFSEGCKPDKDGNVYFTDQPNDRIHLWSTDGKLSTFLEPSGRSNGLFIDTKGTLWACADEKNELWTIDVKTKEKKVMVKNFNGKLLNAPNDVWVGPDGSAYFTDPMYARSYWTRDKAEQQDARAVYHLNTKGELKRVEGAFKQPNGITGSLDGKTLYVADINDRKTYAYTLGEGGVPKDRKLFCEAGSDGMTVDATGNVYLTSGKVLVFDKTGKKVAELAVPEGPANVCFGGKDFRTLFITARTGLYAVQTNVKGK